MGVDGLLRALRGIEVPMHLRELRGQKCAVDTYAWIHRGTYACAADLCMDGKSEAYVTFCLNMLDCLLEYNITPIMVFDGARLQAKEGVEKDRESRRANGLEAGKKFLAEGKQKEAVNAFVRAVDVTPQMARKVIMAFRRKGVQVIVAPYEADAQLAYLTMKKHVDFVVSEDSDLLAFGCTKVFYKFDRTTCVGQMIDLRRINLAEEVYLRHFTHEMFLDMCIISGCDYLEGLPGVGLKTAHSIVARYKRTSAILRGLRFECRSKVIAPDYEKRFYRAKLTFKHQIVYCPELSAFTHLSRPVTCEEMPSLLENLDFLGVVRKELQQEGMASKWAEGDINTETFELFVDEPETIHPNPQLRPSMTVNTAENNQINANRPAASNKITNFFSGTATISRTQTTCSVDAMSTKNPWIGRSSTKPKEAQAPSHNMMVRQRSRFFGVSSAPIGGLRAPPSSESQPEDRKRPMAAMTVTSSWSTTTFTKRVASCSADDAEVVEIKDTPQDVSDMTMCKPAITIEETVTAKVEHFEQSAVEVATTATMSSFARFMYRGS